MRCALEPDLPIFDVRTLEEHLGVALLPQRAAAALLGAFGALALVRSVVGIYSDMAYAVSQRAREVGIRMALGAQVRDVLTLILRQGVIVVGIGVVAGAAFAMSVTRFASSLLYGISPTDPVTFAGAIATLAAAGLVAAIVPARRAARIQPTEALRQR